MIILSEEIKTLILSCRFFSAPPLIVSPSYPFWPEVLEAD
jgi:hypothetical protein